MQAKKHRVNIVSFLLWICLFKKYTKGIVQLSEDQVDQFNQIVKIFNQQQKDTLVVIFTGTTNHWITYIAHKDFVNNEKKFYFLDSANLSLNDLLDENIEALLNEIENKQKERNVQDDKNNRESNMQTTITSFKDRKTVLNLLNNVFINFRYILFLTLFCLKCFLEKVRLEVYMIENQFKEMFVTFTEYFPNWREQLETSVFDGLQNQENQLNVEMLITFIKHEYRPQVIENDILKVMRKYSEDFEKYFDQNYGKLIIQWINLNQATLQNIHNQVKDDQDIINMTDKYIVVIQEIKFHLEKFC